MPNARVAAAAGGLPTRRATFAALAGLGAALVLPKAVHAMPAGADLILPLYAESRRVCALINGGHHATEAEADALMDRWGDCCNAAAATKATTTAGAIASLEWALEELTEFGFDLHKPDNGTRFVLAMLDGALGVLRAQGGAL